MRSSKDKASKNRNNKNNLKEKGRLYDRSDDDSEREVSSDDGRIKKHRNVRDQFKQYMDEMHEYYQAQQAYLQEQNTQCFQQLFQFVYQGQQNQPITPQLPGGHMPPYSCVQKVPQPTDSTLQHNPQPTGYNNNNNPLPLNQHYPQPTTYNNNNLLPDRQHPSPTSYNHPLTQQYPPSTNYHDNNPPPPTLQYPPPPDSEDVLYEDTLNGTRITISEAPPIGHHLVSASHHGGYTTQSDSLAVEGDTKPRVNLYITVAPPTFQQPPPTSQQAPPTFQQPPPTSQQAPPTFQQAPPTFQQAPPTFQQAPPTFKKNPATPQPVQLHTPQGQHKPQSLRYGVQDLKGARQDAYLPRRRSVRDALRERMRDPSR